ncbi:MAG: NAD(P)/FAD-dependent oxidoreductase [Acidimicrobiales bacterium]
MAEQHEGIEVSVEELRAKYAEEQLKRLRPDGLGQYVALRDQFEALDQDPYADPNFKRDSIIEETEVVIVGGGFGGMLTAIELRKLGINDFRIVEKGGDFGGTWYWNRYPGCMCDVESYTYLPLLEETGYMPTERYASAPEIFGYCQLLGRTYNLYENALFQTVITDAIWDDDANRWNVTTSRGDQLRSTYIVIAGGLLHKPKVPIIPDLELFKGKMFHTTRWDYNYTGGAPGIPMDKLGDKRVGIIGTGATAIQAVPKLAEVAQELLVFQRTPSAVGVRGNRPTDEKWFRSQKPGWQQERIVNFTHSVTGVKPAIDLVDDGWTDVMWTNTMVVPESPDHASELEISDLKTMEKMRVRVDEIVKDPATAEKLKAYYGKNCKRVCFHDDYLPSFNRPNVQLVDTNGKGIERATETGIVVDGVEHEIDCLIFASGFEVFTDLDVRLGFNPVGRDGVTLSESWSHGAHTLHGVLSGGFPNMMVISLVQSGFGTNFVHFLARSGRHVAEVINACKERGIVTIEAAPDAEADWLMVLYGAIGNGEAYTASCTPSYFNSDMAVPDEKSSKGLVYSGSLLDYHAYLDEFRSSGDFPGALVTKS